MNYDHWVPGLKSGFMHKSSSSIKNKVSPRFDELEQTAPHIIRTKTNQYFCSKRNTYDIKRVEQARNIPLERRANVYMDQQTKDYLEAMENKKKFPKEMYVALNHT